MNIILLSGGSGKRLWPLSNDIRSKQFLKLFKNEEGNYESMLQRMYRGIRKIDPDANITIATAQSQVSEIRNQVHAHVDISIEPCRKDTFPAIVLAACYLQEKKHISNDAPVVVCPVDPYVEDDYFRALQQLSELAMHQDANLVLLGMEPSYPSEKYGYIIPDTKEEISTVREFKEKPDAVTAEEYIRQGALWNGGVFAFRLGYLLQKAHEMIAFQSYSDLLEKYDSLHKISFDYAVVEKEKKIKVLRFHGVWKDLGTWNTLTEAMSENTIGKGIMDDSSQNAFILNELNIPVLAMGVKDAVISASPDGILVSDLHQSSYIKPYVDQIEQPVMYAEKSWGSFQVMDIEKESMTIKVTLLPGHRMNYHSHAYRDEVWVFAEGQGRVVLDGVKRNVQAGDHVQIKAGCRHTVIADTQMQIIEIQLGKDISVYDKEIFPLEEE